MRERRCSPAASISPTACSAGSAEVLDERRRVDSGIRAVGKCIAGESERSPHNVGGVDRPLHLMRQSLGP